MQRNYLYTLIFFLILKAVLILGVIGLGLIELGPDEAQYWTWSKMLDWGYYSKPPAIAWQIAFGTNLFGDTELGVRFGAVVLGLLLPIAIYALSIAAGTKSHTAFWAAIAFACMPLGVLASILAITDTGFVLFWTLALIPVVKAIRDGVKPAYALVGLLIALGALYKWPIYYLWLFIMLGWLWIPTLRSPSILVGMILSLLGLLPSLYWNVNHDWATFKHVAATIEGGSQVETRAGGNFWAFIGEQFLLFSPLLFLLLLGAIHRTRAAPRPLFFCGAITALGLAVFTIFSLFQKIQGNWCDFIYPSGIVFLAWCALEGNFFKNWAFYAGVLVALVCSAIALSLPLWAPYKFNPFKQNSGWKILSQELSKLEYNPAKDFLVGDRYQTTSLLSFYGPAQKRGYFLNLKGIRRNQFSYWPSLKEEKQGSNGYYVVVDKPEKLVDTQNYVKKVEPYFQKVEVKGIYPLVHSKDQPVKSALIIKGIGYNGQEPTDSQLY